MLRGIPLVVLALSIAVVAGYIEVYVENGPDLDGLHIYAWDGGEWVPVGVTYVPEYIDTYIAAVGQWAQMPYYNMSRYILEIPREAFRRGPPRTPPGLEKWTLEVQNGTRKTAVDLAVGRTPITKGNLTLTTWYALGDQPPKTPHRGRFINPPRAPPKNNAATEADTASHAVSPGTTIYPIGSLYFKPVRVRSGWFSTYVPVDTPDGLNTACELPNMHWVGFEVQNFTVGVKVSGTIYYGTLTLEFYNINLDGTCTYITKYSTWLPSSGSRWENVNVQLPQDSQIGVRIRVDGYAPYDATIEVNIVARYKKTVDNLAQIATSKATTRSSFIVPASNREKVALLFGPYVAYDGLAATAAGTTYNYIHVLPHTVMLHWTGPCPWLIVTYYVNGMEYTNRAVAPSTYYPAGYYCRYDVPSTVLQLRARDYTISKAQSRGGGITVSISYFAYRQEIVISFDGYLEIVYDRWIEPFHSNYIDRYFQKPYLDWGVMLLLNTYQILQPINVSNVNIISEIRASRDQLVLSLAHNQISTRTPLCGAEWWITAPVSGPRLYYGNEQVDEQWWAALGKRVLDAVDWFLTLYGDSNGGSSNNVIASIVVKVVYNVFETASGSVSVSSSNGLYIVRWIKGWAESTPPTVVIELARRSSSSPLYAEWKYFAEGYQTSPTDCVFVGPRVVNTNMYLSPDQLSGWWARLKIWTWRGQTDVARGALRS